MIQGKNTSPSFPSFVILFVVDFCLWSSNGGVLYRGNDEVLKEML